VAGGAKGRMSRFCVNGPAIRKMVLNSAAWATEEAPSQRRVTFLDDSFGSGTAVPGSASPRPENNAFVRTVLRRHRVDGHLSSAHAFTTVLHLTGRSDMRRLVHILVLVFGFSAAPFAQTAEGAAGGATGTGTATTTGTAAGAGAAAAGTGALGVAGVAALGALALVGLAAVAASGGDDGGTTGTTGTTATTP
jgi:hypothetical protein